MTQSDGGPGRLIRYGASVGATLASLVLASVLGPLLEVSPFPIFLAAVTFSAWFGGMGPGLLATVSGVAALDFLFFDPTYTLVVHYATDAVNLAVFALVALLISSLNARLRSARLRADLARAEVERHRDEFLANVSHDLRTPLTAIKHSIEVVLANEPRGTPEPLHELFVNIDQASARMTRLVDDLLALTRLQAGKVRLRTEPCDLSDVVAEAVRAIEPLARSRDQRIELETPSDPVLVDADAERLERALLNVLGNANKYGRAGGVIHVAVEARDGEAVVAVADDGPGVPEAERPRIFERFYRGEGEAIRHSSGSGLGLPIARGLVELHGGRIWLESRNGGGAVFLIALPMAELPAKQLVTA